MINMPRAKKVVETAPEILKTFKVRRVVEYIVEAKNEYHAENKVNKLATNSDYASETPVSDLTISTVIVEKVS
jgi:CRISPR/Cas system CMR-associated protein Cmr3 (group 5 of RAMP superfamily)